ncbi:MAG TPA: GH116 family glycosyl hydrolase [Tepidisphaeraceae bacterium]|nr:GH116 family glycosyl hydrolase [Tepidisphaeraceae bacterium]
MGKQSGRQACGCGSWDRRDFLKLAAAGMGTLVMGPLSGEVMAGPFTAGDFEKLVPADKKLRPEWVRSLFERGSREFYQGQELEKIGMPIGGICAGQLYLGGDGKLWHWDIFNQHIGTGDGHYAKPMAPASPIEQGFAVCVMAGGKREVRTLDRAGFKDIRFCGEYPIGFVEYRDAQLPVQIDLEAFSPFIPLNAEDSALPATILRYTVRNTSQEKVGVEIGGWLENAVYLYSGKTGLGRRINRIVRREGMTYLECMLQVERPRGEEVARADIPFEDFEKETYEGWTATGTAFGNGPIEKSKMPGYQGDVGSGGKRLVNTHNARNGEDVGGGDRHIGTLTSRSFVIERNFITFLIGGGAHKGKTCINLLVDGKVVDSATGANDNRMKRSGFNVKAWAGKTGQLQIVDAEAGGWGNVGIDEIVFTDRPVEPVVPLEQQGDFGTMGLGVLNSAGGDSGIAALANTPLPGSVFARGNPDREPSAARSLPEKLIGALSQAVKLEAGQEASVTFVVTWHFPNLKLSGLSNIEGRRYGKRFKDAGDVATYIANNFDALRSQTRLWHETWYDSTLPYWFLDRTFANTSILASSTCYWFGNGRFYGWEGVGCCPGTCGHVWHYAHAVGRLFPQLERSLREMVDLSIAMDPKSGAIRFRAEHNDFPAADGQAGVVLRSYREHQMSADDAFLKRNWPRIKKALEYLIQEDGDNDGILRGKQHNTLDTDWYGPVAWLSSLYLAALRAGEEMAKEVGDHDFARRTRGIFEIGQKRVVELCWNGEYFVHRSDPKVPDAMKSGNGCEIDQVFGQSWAYQVGLGRIIDEDHTKGALRSIWRYNFTPDVGPFRNANKLGRWYAMPGEAGVLMCTWPKGDKADAQGKAPDWAFGYFNECMNGFEYQVGGHMIWEGMVQEGLAVARSVHDRYHAGKRNPWNEVECGDHYARSMASYGVFLAACGYEYHGPRGRLAFSPRLTPENFRAPFTTAEGWGTFEQKRSGTQQVDSFTLRWGQLHLEEIGMEVAPGLADAAVKAWVNDQAVGVERLEAAGGEQVEVRLVGGVELKAGDRLVIQVGRA